MITSLESESDWKWRSNLYGLKSELSTIRLRKLVGSQNDIVWARQKSMFLGEWVGGWVWWVGGNSRFKDYFTAFKNELEWLIKAPLNKTVYFAGHFWRIPHRVAATSWMEVGASKMQHQRRKSTGGVRLSQVGLVAEEEHGLRQKNQELYWSSKRSHSQRNDGPKFNQIHWRSCVWNCWSKT